MMKVINIAAFLISCVIFSLSSVYADISSGEQYKIEINDVLNINVIDHDKFSSSAVVSVDGTISLPYIGSVMVKGLSLTEIQEEITKKLKAGYVKYPVVNVSLLQASKRYIYTYGEIQRRGEIGYVEGMTVLMALSLAGGASIDGLYGKLRVLRKPKNSVIYRDFLETNLNHGLIDDNSVKDTRLKYGDMLIIEKSKTFLIQGEVGKRGRYVLAKDMTVLRALLEAGGVSVDGRYGRIKLRRKAEGEQGGYNDIAESKINDGEIESSKVEEVILQHDDILIVERNETFLMQGEVGKRGRYVLEKDMTVLRGLLQSGGVTDNALYGKIRIRRKDITLEGEYEDLLTASLYDGVIEDRKVESELLQPDDIILIERNKTVLIYGEVLRPGEYVLKDKMTAFKVITIAGGFTKWGSADRVKILRQSGDAAVSIKVDIDKVIDGDVGADMQLKSGDVLIASPGVF